MNKKNNILIIGHKSFIGSHLLNKLNIKNNNIYLISKKVNKKVFAKREFKFDVFNDFRWFKHLKNNMIIYFLAFNNNLYELEKKKEYILEIINFSIQFNEYLIKKKIKVKLIFTSTATIYGCTNTTQIVNEKLPDKPLSVYDLSKLYFEKIFTHYSKNKYLKFVSLRLVNIYGQYSKKSQINRGFLNKLIYYSFKNKSFNIIGNGNKLRNYLYIDDLINALKISASKINKLNSKVFLVCNEKSYSFNEVIKLVKKNLKKKIKYKNINFPKKMHIIALKYPQSVIGRSRK